jgi:RNA-directed DNA polymerase
VNEGDLSNQKAARSSTEVRVTIVAEKSGNSDGAKGGRIADTPGASSRESESEPSSVPKADKQGGEDLWQHHKAQRGVWSEGMLVALDKGVKGNKWFSLIDKVYAGRTLQLAWEKVLSNAGSCGIDGTTVDLFKKDSQERLLALNEQLKAGHFQPVPVKRTWIEKLGSAQKRPLGIPTVTDRVVQTAVRMAIEPIFERDFAPHSYGFRPGRGCQGALRHVEDLLKKGHLHVVDIDIKGYFDNIPQDKLLEIVGEKIADGRVMTLLKQFLQAGVMEQGKWQETLAGTPQGGVISPLLANIYLNDLDWLMAGAGFEMVRYADDMVVLCRDAQTARDGLERVDAWMKTRGLTLHPEKTKIVDMTQVSQHFDFLGYRFYHSKLGYIRQLIRTKSKQKLCSNLKALTRRVRSGCLSEIIAKQLNPILRGWYGHFKHACPNALEEIDGWVRQRLRGILRHRKRYYGRPTPKDHKRWPNSYFHKLKLFCLRKAQENELTKLQQKAC